MKGEPISFGMPTLIEADGLEECAALCRELGLSFVELNMNMPQYQLGVLDADGAATIAQTYGIGYSMHLDENLNVADFNPYIAQGYMRTVIESIALARRLHMPVLNMHMHKGVYFTLPDKRVYLYDAYKEPYLKAMSVFQCACEQAVGDSGVMICIENCDGYLPFQCEAMDRLLQSPVFALTFDVGHNHSCGMLDEAYIQKNQAHLLHMHLHDAMEKKNHLALGAGEMEIERYLRLACEKKCRVVLETKTIAGLRESVQWLKHHGWMPAGRL